MSDTRDATQNLNSDYSDPHVAFLLFRGEVMILPGNKSADTVTDFLSVCL